MKKIGKIFSKRSRFVYGLVSLGLVTPAIAFASADAVMNLLGQVVFAWVLTPAILLLKLELWLLPKIASYNNFVREPGVGVGWVAVRDLVNTFFIVILLIIAFATILRISSYGYKQLLSRLLIVAILVNFSMTIVGLAIDFSQIIMLTFLNAIGDILAGNVMVGLGLTEVFNMSKDYDLTDGSPGFTEIISSLVMAAIMLVITVVILAAFIGMLAMRIVKLWISIVLSPAAFVAFVFPSAKKYYTEWSLDLGKNLVAGPALLFFLWLSFTIINGIDVGTAMNLGSDPDALGAFSEATTVQNITKYIIGTALLLGGLQFAAKSGAAGASLMGKASSKINSTASAMGKRYAGGMASRAGAGIARTMVDEKGNAKGAFKALKLDKSAFWGGRLQRGAMKMQGYDAARISAEREGDQRYISDDQKVAFQGTQASAYFSGVKGDSKLAKTVRGAGQALSFATSVGGGIQDSKVRLAQNRVSTGEDLGEHEDETYKALKRVNDQDSIDRMQSDGYIRNMTKRDAANMVDKHGVGMLNKRKYESMFDKDGNASQGSRNYMDALIANPDIDSHQISGEQTKRGASKPNRHADAKMIIEDLKAGMSDPDGPYKGSIIARDEHGRAKFDQTGQVELETNSAFMKQLNVAMSTYPDIAGELAAQAGAMANYEVMEGGQKLGKGALENIPRRNNEDNESYDKRVKKHKDEEVRALTAAGGDEDNDDVQKNRRKARGFINKEEAKDALVALGTQKAALNPTDEDYDRKVQKLDDKKASVYASAGIQFDGSDEPFEKEMGRFFAERKNKEKEGEYLKDRGYDEGDSKYKVDENKAREKAEKEVSNADVVAAVGPRPAGMSEENWIIKQEEKREDLVADKEKSIIKTDTAKKEIIRKKDEDAARKKMSDDGIDISTELTNAIGKIEDAFDAVDLKHKPALDEARAKQVGKIKTDPAFIAAKKEEVALLRQIAFAKREASGAHANLKTDIGTGAVVRAAQDGMSYERLFEMDITDQTQKDMFMNFSIQANQDQQKQLLNTATPAQIALFAESLAKTGTKVSKVIMDNLAPNVQMEVYQIMAQVKYTQDGMSRMEAIMKAAAMDIGALKKDFK